ncbi:uncharacterized protein LOC144703522 [Wolffia australiana]
MQAHKLDVLLDPNSPSQFAGLCSSAVSSLLLEPFSRAIALHLSDSSLLLYPPLLSPPPLPSPTVVPPFSSSSSCFLRLLRSSNSSSAHVLFLSASSHGPSLLLRAWLLPFLRANPPLFSPVRLVSNSKRDMGRLQMGLPQMGRPQMGSLQMGLVLDHRHGLSVSLSGSTNVFSLHCPAEDKIFVYAASLRESGKGEFEVKLVKCAVLDCTSPVFSIQMSAVFLLLGEISGIRVFPLRPLVQGRTGRKRNAGVSESLVPGKSAKLRTVKIRQNSAELGSYFVEFSHATTSHSALPIRAKSIHVLKQRRYLILDSTGDVHLLHLNKQVASESSREESLVRLNCSMRVQMLAAYPDQSNRGQIIWVSDGLHSVHVMKLADAGECDKADKMSGEVSAIRAILTGAKMRDIAGLSENAALILQEGGLFLYEITGT